VQLLGDNKQFEIVKFNCRHVHCRSSVWNSS